MSLSRDELSSYLEHLFQIKNYADYGPNGLQIEGCSQITKIAFAVSATKKSALTAAEWGAHALIVHHGLFWKFHGVRTLTGTFGKRIRPLIKNDINLYGLHLPLDAQMEIGNAASLAKKLQLKINAPFGDYKGMPTGIVAHLPTAENAQQFAQRLTQLLGRSPLVASPDLTRPIKSIGIITGGANSDWIQAQKQKLDAYLTGEMSEHDWHEAQEAGIHMFAAGHHATEQFGILALKEKMEKDFQKIETLAIDSENPA